MRGVVPAPATISLNEHPVLLVPQRPRSPRQRSFCLDSDTYPSRRIFDRKADERGAAGGQRFVDGRKNLLVVPRSLVAIGYLDNRQKTARIPRSFETFKIF